MFLKRFLAALSFAGLAFGVHTASAQEPDSTSVEQRDRQGEGLEDMSGVFHNQYKRLIHFSRNLSATLYSFVRPLFS